MCGCCFVGVLYDNIAGIEAEVGLHLVDLYKNDLIAGSNMIELAYHAVAGRTQNLDIVIEWFPVSMYYIS
jgi:hypothetical protein